MKLFQTAALFTIPLIFSALSGCDSKRTLTREKAQTIIEQAGLEPITEPFNFGTALVSNAWGATSPELIASLERSGVIKVLREHQKSEWPAKGSWPENTYLTPTDQGRRYVTSSTPLGTSGSIQSKVMMAELKLKEITGVGEPSQMFGKTMSMVTFKYNYIPTPFGTASEQVQKKPNLYSGWATGTAHLVLYDDGWRFEGWSRQ